MNDNDWKRLELHGYHREDPDGNRYPTYAWHEQGGWQPTAFVWRNLAVESCRREQSAAYNWATTVIPLECEILVSCPWLNTTKFLGALEDCYAHHRERGDSHDAAWTATRQMFATCLTIWDGQVGHPTERASHGP